MKIKREVKVGILVVFCLFFFFWGFNFLKGKNYLSGNRIFYAVYNQVNGLVEANGVMINGVKAGEVREISFTDDKGTVLVEFAVDKNIKIPRNSISKIYSSDVLGSKAIEIVLGDSKTMAESGDTLKSFIQPSITDEVSAQMRPIKAKAETLMASLDSVLTVIQYIFNESTRDNLKQSFESIRNTISNLESTTYNLDTLMTTQRGRLSKIIYNVESITGNFKNNNAKLTNVINNFSDISDSLSKITLVKTLNKADEVLKNFSEISEKINKGEGTLSLLINNDSLYKGLEKSSRELNLLLEDIRLNPQRYVHISVFGKKADKNLYKSAVEKK